jgi:hypothetical protein
MKQAADGSSEQLSIQKPANLQKIFIIMTSIIAGQNSL